MQSIAIDPGWAGWVFTSPTQILKNHVWIFSAALRMSRLEKNSIKTHLNQDIKPPICSLQAPWKFLWLMPADGCVADDPSRRYSGHGDSHWPDAGNSCVETTVGPFCVQLQLLPHRHSLEGEKEMPHDSKGLFPWTALLSSLWQWSTELSASKDQIYCPHITKEDFPGVQEFSQIKNI